MKFLARRCLAVCLATIPTASAAPFLLPPVSIVKILNVPAPAHGLDWNTAAAPDASPFALVEELQRNTPRFPPIDAPPPVRVRAADMTDPLAALFLTTLLGLVAMAASLFAIPYLHLYRARRKAFYVRIPLN